MSEEEKKEMNSPEQEVSEKPAEKVSEEVQTASAEAAPAPAEDVKPEANAAAAKVDPREQSRKPGMRRRPQSRRPNQGEDSEFIERVVKISRVSKVVKGGKNFSFNAMVVAGDGKGQVGIGFGKSNEVVEAIRKGSTQAKGSFFKVKMKGDTIPHEIIGRFKATHVIMKPAGPGTGVIAGGPVRALCDAAGIKNILTKSLGSRNSINVVKAAVNGFENLRLERRG